MTIEEFDTIKWGASSMVVYKNEYETKIMNVGSVCFIEKLLGVYDINNESGHNDCNCNKYDWIRCENAELHKNVSK
jgi:hypothetical protein